MRSHNSDPFKLKLNPDLDCINSYVNVSLHTSFPRKGLIWSRFRPRENRKKSKTISSSSCGLLNLKLSNKIDHHMIITFIISRGSSSNNNRRRKRKKGGGDGGGGGNGSFSFSFNKFHLGQHTSFDDPSVFRRG